MSVLLLGLLGGLITGISPCVLPVLPVVFLTAGAGASRPGDAPEAIQAPRSRPYWVIGGLLVGFTFVTLAGSSLLALLPIPQDTIRWIGIAALLLIGLGLLLPALQRMIERPFQRLLRRAPENTGNGFGTGLALGTVFVPCAGPVLAAIVVAGATGTVGADTVLLALSFAVGVAIPLLAFAIAGNRVAQRIRGFRRRERGIRALAGVATMLFAGALIIDAPQALQSIIPDYTASIQKSLIGDENQTTQEADSLRGCASGAAELQNCGPAPAITGITTWLNTPDGKPLTAESLTGTVTIVDFWTFDCINCRRAIPHVTAWYEQYHDVGLETIGVHSPEYPFERELAGVKRAAADLGIHYPIAVDNDFTTWDSFSNNYWPALYLIDAQGQVRHVAYGEGAYDETEELIRELLVQADPDVDLPPRTDVPDLTATWW